MSGHNSFTHYVPLFIFTCLMIFAAGLTLGSAIDHLFYWGYFLPELVGIAVVAASFLGLSASFLHLGRKERAWRTVAGILRSWLSIEAVIAGTFTGVVVLAFCGLQLPGIWLLPWAALGLSIILPISIGMLYRLGAQKAWNKPCHLIHPLVTALFFASALLAHNTVESIFEVSFWVLAVMDILIFVSVFLERKRSIGEIHHLEFPRFVKLLKPLVLARFVMLLAGVILAGLGYFHFFIIFLGVALVIDRFLFYAMARKQTPGNDLAEIKTERMKAALK